MNNVFLNIVLYFDELYSAILCMTMLMSFLFWFTSPGKKRKNITDKNLSILNISSNSDPNLFWDAKILRTRKIMTLF